MTRYWDTACFKICCEDLFTVCSKFENPKNPKIRKSADPKKSENPKGGSGVRIRGNQGGGKLK